VFKITLGQKNFLKNLEHVSSRHKQRIAGLGTWAVDETGLQEMLDRSRVDPKKKLDLVLYLNRNYPVKFTAAKPGCKMCRAFEQAFERFT
jgi:hypothetical protein